MDFEVVGARFWRIFWSPDTFFGMHHRICRIMHGAFQVAELTLMIRATGGRSMIEWMNGWMDVCMDGWMDGWLGGWMDRWFNRPMDA